MSTLEIYNSQGEQLDGGPTDTSQQIEQFFFDGVRLYLDTTDQLELTVFFRARESDAGRAEQYYAVYETQNATGLFRGFDRALRAEIEDERDMILQTDSSDAQIVSLFSTDQPVPGSEREHGAISSLLSEGASLQLAAGSPSLALGLIQRYISSPAQELAIVDDTAVDSAANWDFVVESGAESDLEALGTTADDFDAKLQRTTANAERSRATGGAATASSDATDQAESFAKNALAVGVGIVVAAIVAVVLLNVAALVGLEFPTFGPIIFV
jgi:hypothetical protein